MRGVNKIAFTKSFGRTKGNEASQGYDGTWVAHLFLFPIAMDAFNKKFLIKSPIKSTYLEMNLKSK
jgi:malate synthase